MGFGAWGLRFGVRGLEFGAWNVGFGVWDFFVWGLVFRGLATCTFGVWFGVDRDFEAVEAGIEVVRGIVGGGGVENRCLEFGFRFVPPIGWRVGFGMNSPQMVARIGTSTPKWLR